MSFLRFRPRKGDPRFAVCFRPQATVSVPRQISRIQTAPSPSDIHSAMRLRHQDPALGQTIRLGQPHPELSVPPQPGRTRLEIFDDLIVAFSRESVLSPDDPFVVSAEPHAPLVQDVGRPASTIKLKGLYSAYLSYHPGCIQPH